ncbi:MAG: hypothetical protein JWR84_3424 [Caulobacter sp.]|nr:hypothetical protein [Caulobacter sp.]
MDHDKKQAWVDRVRAFLQPLGIEMRPGVVEPPTILLGMEIRAGVIWYDQDLDIRPGDLLHEAGHLAVGDPARRFAPTFEADGGDEMSAIAWSWAAAKAIGMPAQVLFHEEGHKGHHEAWTDAFETGRYFGLPLLHLYGMTVEPRQARPGDPPVFPHMLRWLR